MVARVATWLALETSVIYPAEVLKHLEVLSSDGQHVGRVDHVRGDQVQLARLDWAAHGKHHTIPMDWIDYVDDRVHLTVTAAEAFAGWQT